MAKRSKEPTLQEHLDVISNYVPPGIEKILEDLSELRDDLIKQLRKQKWIYRRRFGGRTKSRHYFGPFPWLTRLPSEERARYCFYLATREVLGKQQVMPEVKHAVEALHRIQTIEKCVNSDDVHGIFVNSIRLGMDLQMIDLQGLWADIVRKRETKKQAGQSGYKLSDEEKSAAVQIIHNKRLRGEKRTGKKPPLMPLCREQAGVILKEKKIVVSDRTLFNQYKKTF